MTMIERIMDELNKRGMKQKVICDACGIAPSTLSLWFKRAPEGIPSEYIPKIAALFDMSCDELLTGNSAGVLTEDERKLLDMYRELDWDGKCLVRAVAIQETRAKAAKPSP